MTGVQEMRVALTVDDFEQAIRLYRDGLGLRPVQDWSSSEGRVVLFEAGRATLEIMDGRQAEMVDRIEVGRRVSGPVRLAFEVQDSRAVADQVVTVGAVPIGSPVSTPWGDHNARVATPEGIQLTLFSGPASEASP